jgi:hypothetical protein
MLVVYHYTINENRNIFRNSTCIPMILFFLRSGRVFYFMLCQKRTNVKRNSDTSAALDLTLEVPETGGCEDDERKLRGGGEDDERKMRGG